MNRVWTKRSAIFRWIWFIFWIITNLMIALYWVGGLSCFSEYIETCEEAKHDKKRNKRLGR